MTNENAKRIPPPPPIGLTTQRFTPNMTPAPEYDRMAVDPTSMGVLTRRSRRLTEAGRNDRAKINQLHRQARAEGRHA